MSTENENTSFYKVLIADDEQIIRRGLHNILDWNALGFDIVGEAASGSEVLRAIDSLCPDLILMDIRMPGLNGLDTIRQAREDGFTGHFIVLSGYSDFQYAQTAIRHGVTAYLTKPVDMDDLQLALEQVLEEIREQDRRHTSRAVLLSRARSSVLGDLLRKSLTESELTALLPDPAELGFSDKLYQVILYEKFSHNLSDPSYSFAELLRMTGCSSSSFDELTLEGRNVIILKGETILDQFDAILERFERELPPEKNSPLDSIFLTCGRRVSDLAGLHASYADACDLITHRFYSAEGQHIMRYGDTLPKDTAASEGRYCCELLEEYTNTFMGLIQAYHRGAIADALQQLQNTMYHSPDSIPVQKNFLVDLYLRIKEQFRTLYPDTEIPFGNSSEAIGRIQNSYYLYEIIAFLSEQYDVIISTLGAGKRESIIEDIVNYIDHNYAENITLEKIAPLFGYNSSYLGKIFSRKMNVNFNTYLDRTRVEHSLEFLCNTKDPVYRIAEKVGYKNVDYFHIKFKKQMGISPAEYRKQNGG